MPSLSAGWLYTQLRIAGLPKSSSEEPTMHQNLAAAGASPSSQTTTWWVLVGGLPGPYSEVGLRGVEPPRKVYTKISGSTFLRNDHDS